jgi:hypothetical protein
MTNALGRLIIKCEMQQARTTDDCAHFTILWIGKGKLK